MTRRAISPRLATRTACRTGSGGLGGGSDDRLERGDAPAGAGGHPAEQQGDARGVAGESELRQAMLAHAREGHHAMAAAARGEQALLQIPAGRGGGVEPPASAAYIAGGERLAEGVEGRGQ